MIATYSASFVIHQYYHAVLPRDVPGREDHNLHQIESDLLERLIKAVKKATQHAPLEHVPQVDSARLALMTCKALNVDGKVDKNLLLKELQQLNTDQALILHITEQNAGLVVYPQSSAGNRVIVFEAFETSATSEKVLASKGALQWDFPGQAVSLTHDVFSAEDFQENLATFLEQASLESIKQFSAVTYKACAPIPEIRDTADPAMISGLLMAILEANGAPHYPKVLRKRVRDTVCFDKAHKPWRRSGFYLLVRVAIQRHLYRLLGHELGRLYYKVIMCIFLSTLMEDAISLELPLVTVHNIRQKLGNRLAKLELYQIKGTKALKDTFCNIFRSLRPIFEKLLTDASRVLQFQWEKYRSNTTRVIRLLPKAAMSSDFTLKLMMSGPALNRAMLPQAYEARTPHLSPLELLGRYERNKAVKPFVIAMQKYLPLFNYEEAIMPVKGSSTNEHSCITEARKIADYIATIQEAYTDYPEFKSRQLLNLMELWVNMDENAVACYALLKEYHPGFTAEILNVLELSSLDDLKRLHNVQSYIATRCSEANGNNKTIFATPAPDTFAVRYYDASPDNEELKQLRSKIHDHANLIRDRKREEWEKLSAQHTELMEAMAGMSCFYDNVPDENGFLRPVHRKPCQKHKLKWQAKQIVIQVFEHPLPASEPASKSVVFELLCPQAFAAYRDATWLLLSTFAYPKSEKADNVYLLKSYSGLKAHQNRNNFNISLGSITKSHLQSHYGTSGFPVGFHEVCRSFPLRLDYYDNSGQMWTQSQEPPSFAHHFPLKLPVPSPFEPFARMTKAWPSSNAILANQPKCPADLNVHEYMAWQGLLLGTYCRWPSLLRELGSTNLNFSADSTWALVSKLILEVGPDSSGQLRRDTHITLNEPEFCDRLLEQISYRLESSRQNWREPIQMDLLISMLLKVISLCSNQGIQELALIHLHTAREITRGWYTRLQSGYHQNGHGHLNFVTWAAVLCKRTFYSTFHSASQVSSDCLRQFIGASIALYNSLVGKFQDLPYNLRNRVLQDLFSVHSIRYQLRDSIITDENALLLALNDIWPIPPSFTTTVELIYSNGKPNWACVTLSSVTRVNAHRILYHIIHGTLLIDGQPVGSLPLEYQLSPVIKELFGSQNVQTFPSALPGMSLVVHPCMPNGHWVHLGFRNNDLVVRAEREGSLLELIQRSVFGNQQQCDLPAPLILDCYHWLDVSSGEMEIRRHEPWNSKPGNWRLSLQTRTATRRSGSRLIDPYSNLAMMVSRNFYMFEYPFNITVYQPPRGNLRVELKRLELDFFVNRRGLLQCPQLGAVIVESKQQDIGTWYGLRSKIVFRSVKNPSQFSILVPRGEMVCKKDSEQQHVTIFIRNSGNYLRFGVNHVLGRVECPADPLLLYTKVLLHAHTSHFIPDTLTGRTGVEEALEYLQSGACQPWKPLPSYAIEILLILAKLSPRRLYYPASLKCMETVRWDSALTSHIQDDRYRGLVEKILQRDRDLSKFSGESAHESASTIAGDIHLETRGLARAYAHNCERDAVYEARDRRMPSERRENVLVVSKLLSEWSSGIALTERAASLLQTFPIIGGYGTEFKSIQLSDVLSLDLGIEWGAIATTAFRSFKKDKFRLMFLFSPIAFALNAPINLIRYLISFAVLDDLKQKSLPKPSSYRNFKFNELPDASLFVERAKCAKVPFDPDQNRDTPRGQLVFRRLAHDKKSLQYCEDFVKSICSQWPSASLQLNELAPVDKLYFDVDEALETIIPEYTRLASNFELSKHLEEVEIILQQHTLSTRDELSIHPLDDINHYESYPLQKIGDHGPCLRELLQKLSPVTKGEHEHSPAYPIFWDISNGVNRLSVDSRGCGGDRFVNAQSRYTQPEGITELRRLVAPYKHSASLVQRRYGNELEQSINALCNRAAESRDPDESTNTGKLSAEITRARNSVDTMLQDLRRELQNNEPRAKWLQHADLWPKMTHITLLAELCSAHADNLRPAARDRLIDLGLAITKYQRLLRIQDAMKREREQQFMDELNNTGHENWFPRQHADWLLLEIESDIMIRPEQVDVALATISPESGENSVAQLLMGKGKTSCILPMVALELSNNNLFRIVVPKPLLHQSSQILQSKLGGLLSREIMHIPFSRQTSTNLALMQTYCDLHNYIKKQHGVILALPEHILSFKLGGLQRLCDGRLDEARVMIKAQNWLDGHARDVLDECDVSLAIRTQLIYPSGSQMAVDGHPLRWQTIEALLHLVVLCLPELSYRFPNSIEIVNRAGFPLIYLLRKDVEDYLVTLIVDSICNGHTPILPCTEITSSSREAIKAIISESYVDRKVLSEVASLFKEKKHLLNVTYHLRGLIVHRIFLSTLKKRWNVQYGLHPLRDPIAVPYQAKGVPSPTAEWGHPDVAIILTCLSFYYEGLSLKQFKQAFDQLAKSDEPSVEYDKWLSTNTPDGLSDFNAINVEDVYQLRELHQYVRYNTYLLDFYLNHFVFPRHAKQFDTKLQASGWDLVLFDHTRRFNCRTTGFSGTNDSRHQLPMMIKQNELPQLAHTNAQVLAYLLQARNRRYVCMVDDRTRVRLSEEGLLKKLGNPHSHPDPHHNQRIRILIDAGAQVLEHDNRDLVKTWLKIDYEAPAAVFFDSDHSARVLYRKGTEIPLVASPFVDNLEDCLVYIDESHCRGTDLKLPAKARAALTLGPHLTKDALVQAAMRLRLLGQTQAVTFFSPPEVHQSILDLRIRRIKNPQVKSVSSPDVLHWLLEQTCNAIEHLEPLFFNQGVDYAQRVQARMNNPDFLVNQAQREQYLKAIRSKELQSLEELYGPKSRKRSEATNVSTFAEGLQIHVAELLQRKKDFQDRGIAIQSAALEEVEQEREVEIEVENVREVHSPVFFNALRFPGLDPNIIRFISTGRLTGDRGYQSMFYTLQKTALGQKYEGSITAATEASSIFVSTQFNRTVKLNEPNDNFLRPCQWVLWSRHTEVGLLVSPEEANLLIPMLRGPVKHSGVHLIIYAAPITRRMLQFNNLTHYAIPPLPTRFQIPIWFKIQLGIFSGRLYFDWEEYGPLLEYLGIRSNEEGGPEHKAFSKKPLTFLHDWLSVRRKGQDFEQTPMGFVTTGKPLPKDHPFFAMTDKSRASNAAPEFPADHADEDEESDDGDEQDNEHLFQDDGGDDDDEAFYDAKDFDENENTFFDGDAYVGESENEETSEEE